MFNSQVPAACPQSPEAPTPGRESVETVAPYRHIGSNLCSLIVSDDLIALGSKLDSLIRRTRSREISSDELIRQLMLTQWSDQTALHKCFHSERLGQLNALLEHIEAAAQEGLLQRDQLKVLLLKQDKHGQSALQLFADSAHPGAENLRRLCNCVMRMLQGRLLSPADASDILLQRHQDRGVFDRPMVRGGTDVGQPDALRVLFDFAFRLVDAGAVQAREVLSSIDPSLVTCMFEHAPVRRIEAFIEGIDGLVAAGPLPQAVLHGLIFSAMTRAGTSALDVAETPSEVAHAWAIKDLAAQAKERWFKEASDPSSRPAD